VDNNHYSSTRIIALTSVPVKLMCGIKFARRRDWLLKLPSPAGLPLILHHADRVYPYERGTAQELPAYPLMHQVSHKTNGILRRNV
jgi:hypothetical protein